MAAPAPPEDDVPSPCIGICTLDPDDICQGCGRTIDEIAGWAAMTVPIKRATRDRAARRLAGRPDRM
jgi:uncharacterized protein